LLTSKVIAPLTFSRKNSDIDIHTGGFPMALFRLYLVAFYIILLVYTGIVITDHGINLLPFFFGDMAKMGWPGQFNLDFMGFLSLSALWTAWRHQFRGAGLVLAVLAFFGGMGFLVPYLLYHLAKGKGDMRVLLLGAERAAQ
jgi:hypothetical protein